MSWAKNTYVSGDTVNYLDFNAIGDSIRNWQGTVNAGGNNLTGIAQIHGYLNSILLATSSVPRVVVNSDGNVFLNPNTVTPVAAIPTNALAPIVHLISSGSTAPGLHFRQTGGTTASPTATPSGQSLGAIVSCGWDGAAWRNSATVYCLMAEACTPTAQGTDFVVELTPIGTTSRGIRFRVRGDGVVNIPNTTLVPASNPSGGGFLYTDSGALKYRGSSGTVTVIAAA